MRIVKLRIEKTVSAYAQAGDEMDEGDLGSICASGEHALAKEGAAQGNAVETANQFAIIGPALDAVRMTFAMQRRV